MPITINQNKVKFKHPTQQGFITFNTVASETSQQLVAALQQKADTIKGTDWPAEAIEVNNNVQEITNKVNNLVKFQDTAPSTSSTTQVWVDTSSSTEQVGVPTLEDIALVFNESAVYTAGQYVWHDEHLYKFITDHAAGSWIGTDVVQVSLGNDLGNQVSDLKSAISEQTYNIITGKIEEALVAANGEIQPHANYNVYYAPVTQGTSYTAKTGSNLICGFYVDEPVKNNISYNNNRTIQTSTTITAPITGYIAVRFDKSYQYPQIVEGTEDKKYIAPLTATDNVARLEIENVEESINQLKSTITSLDDGISIIDKNIAWTSAYVNVNGKLVTSSASKTGLFEMQAGETLKVGTQNKNITIIGSTTSDSLAVGDTITVIQRTSAQDRYEEYTYTATNTINIVVCVLAANYNLIVTKKSNIQTQIDAITLDDERLESDIEQTNATIESLDAKNIKSKTLVDSGTSESVWETYAVDLSDDDNYYIALLSVSGVNVSTNPYIAVRNVYSDSSQVVTDVRTIGQLIKIGIDASKTYARTNIVCYRADSAVGTSVESSWEYIIFKGTPNKSRINALVEQANKATTDIGKYTFKFSSNGNAHSSSSDKINITIPHNNACSIAVSLDITASGTYECWATYSDSTTERLLTGYFDRTYTIMPPKNITSLGFSVGSQNGAYECTIALDTNTPTGIIALNGYGYNALLQAKRTINLSSNAYLSNTQPLVLLHFSDIHGTSENLRRIVAFRDEYASLIDDTICTGDMVTDRFSNGMGFWDAVPGTENIMLAIGNHDVLAAASGYDWTDLKSQADQYARYIAPYVSNWDCEYSENKTYYYKDYDSKKVRLICLNCMLTGDDNTAQLTWFASALNGAIIKDYYVIVAVHYPISNHTTVSCGFSSLDKIPYQTQDRLSDDYMSAVNTFITNGGKFGCYLTGHTHTDFMLKSSNYANQLCVVIDAASSSAANADSDTQRTIGTKSQDCANLFVFDSASGAMKIIRIGADMDHYMRPKNDITFKLSDLSIITQS